MDALDRRQPIVILDAADSPDGQQPGALHRLGCRPGTGSARFRAAGRRQRLGALFWLPVMTGSANRGLPGIRKVVLSSGTRQPHMQNRRRCTVFRYRPRTLRRTP